MAVLVFRVPKEKIKEAKALLERDPYAEDSFARLGYKFKEARYLGLEGEDAYIYVDVPDEKAQMVRERLKDFAELEGEEKEKVKEAFEREESGAAAGIGAIFG